MLCDPAGTHVSAQPFAGRLGALLGFWSGGWRAYWFRAGPVRESPGQRGSPRVNAEVPKRGQHKEGSANSQLSTRGRVCPDVPSEPNRHGRGVRRIAPNHQAGGQLSPKDAALHMTDVVLIAWPPDRDPSSTMPIHIANGTAADRRKGPRKRAITGFDAARVSLLALHPRAQLARPGPTAST